MDHCDTPVQSQASLVLSTSARSSTHLSRKTSWGTPIPPPSVHLQVTRSLDDVQDDVYNNIDITVNSMSSILRDGPSGWDDSTNLAALGLSFDANESLERAKPLRDRFALEVEETVGNRSLSLEFGRPFNKWMKNLQRRATRRRKTVSCDMDDSLVEWQTFDGPPPESRSRHKKSSSGSSLGFVTAIKDASISLASLSVAPRSRTGVSSRHHRTDRSSKASNVGRLSEDSSYIARSIVIDQAVANRLIQRRRILEEIISTEESYLADIKFLMHVYVTLMSSIPTLSSNLRASINVNLNEIVELHEDILGDLHREVPHSEYTQPSGTPEPKVPTPANGHNRWRSLDAVPEHAGGSSWLLQIPGMTAEPKVAAAVARIFGNKTKYLFIYEEYGAKYEIMIKDVSTAYRTMPQWEIYQKGLEALASSLASTNSQQDNSKKANTIGDLLVKPIQRVCKYPLLFAELLKQTPVCDCPDSHMEIENVLIRLREATTKINQATDDPRIKAGMEKSWLLQDRLMFADKSDFRSKSFARSLGHIQLCGVLHVAWQTKDGVDGHYMICLLYREFLLLASAARIEQVYTIQACIRLAELKIEEIDNGKGLQCHTAPFSWKAVFEHDHRLSELTMSACSPREELEWRTRLADLCYKNNQDIREQSVLTSLSLDIKPLGTVFGKPGTVARRISIHRATTVGPMSGLCQVVIKNTSTFKDIPHSASSASINRSQSLLTTNRIPVLAPPRAERIRLETILSDVWTRDILPYPGMTGRGRSENPVRVSASSMMRKLSVASIASNFTKRSGSLASLQKAIGEDVPGTETSKPASSRIELNSSGASSSDVDKTGNPKLSITQSEKGSTFKDSHGFQSSTLYCATGASAGPLLRLTSLKAKTIWATDGYRIITPPLRTSSANSVFRSRTASSSTVPDAVDEEKENSSQTPRVVALPEQKQQKHSMRKSSGKRGILNLFR